MSRNKKQSSKTEISKQKQAFRHTAEWRDFRAELIKSQKIDPITLKPLRKGCECHHLLLTDDIEEYKVLSTERQVCLNSNMHKIVHILYEYYKSDPEIINRLVDLLEKMKSLSYINNKGE